MTAPPPLSPERRQAALVKAAAVRRERAEVREGLKCGTLSLREVLATDSPAVRGMPVRALLEALSYIGRVRADGLLAELGISESRRIRGLGVQQRDRLRQRFTPQG
ncbi:integration host factor (plasmid) [Embleya sp. NBC_00888]|uniref:integration host factor, actinobacterial type n=1 Tax=Embleya sp. NBC_00888 TaxID=2975960 RepID=UPI002F919AA2|nr:integration host factor [Embleya sp. NBC_00888]